MTQLIMNSSCEKSQLHKNLIEFIRGKDDEGDSDLEIDDDG